MSYSNRLSFNSVDLGGSNLGDAIYKATHKIFGLGNDGAEDDNEEAGKKPAVGETVMKGEAQPDEQSPNVIIILTDGESHEGHAREMAMEAHRLNVAIYIIGFGSKAGAPIPIEIDGKMTMLKYKGMEVTTSFNDESLRKVIDSIPSRCGYLTAGTSNVDLFDIYKRVISKGGVETKRRRFTVWQEKFQLFVGIGMALLVISSLINEQRPARRVVV